MNLHEYQAKQLFLRYGLPVPTGYTCTTPDEAEDAACKIGCGPWMVKCQLHAGGRYQAGGVKLIKSKDDIRCFSESWLGKRLVTYQTNALGQPVNQMLVEAVIDIDQELYLGVMIDYHSYRVVFLASNKGGVEIEKFAPDFSECIHKTTIDPLLGPQPYQGRALAFKCGLIGKQVIQFSRIFMGLVTLFLRCDLEMLEINPLAITKQGDLVCLDGKLRIDDNALFRQPKLGKMRDFSQENARESHALHWNINYVELNGNIGCIVNGAGLAMGTIDIIEFHGGKPANFLDVGGRVTKESITEAFQIILFDPKVKVVLVNIFGGIVSCDLIADGIISAVDEIGINIPVIVRLEGNNAELGIKKLADRYINVFTTTSIKNAIQQVIAVVESKKCLF